MITSKYVCLNLQKACDVQGSESFIFKLWTNIDRLYKVGLSRKSPIQGNIRVAVTIFHLKISILPGKLIDRVTPNSISLQMYGLGYRFASFHRKRKCLYIYVKV